MKKLTYCYDVDGTLCTKDCEYESAKPFTEVIDDLNKRYSEGNKIIIFTSRGYLSGKDWRVLTEYQLSKWGVKYHELIMGKPHADIFIDDRAFNVDTWCETNQLSPRPGK